MSNSFITLSKVKKVASLKSYDNITVIGLAFITSFCENNTLEGRVAKLIPASDFLILYVYLDNLDATVVANAGLGIDKKVSQHCFKTLKRKAKFTGCDYIIQTRTAEQTILLKMLLK